MKYKNIFKVLYSKLTSSPLDIHGDWPSIDDEIEVNGKKYVKVKFQLVEAIDEPTEKENTHLKIIIKRLEQELTGLKKQYSNLEQSAKGMQNLNILLAKEKEIEIKTRKNENIKNQQRFETLQSVHNSLLQIYSLSEIENTQYTDHLKVENSNLQDEITKLKKANEEAKEFQIKYSAQTNIVNKQRNTIVRITKHVMRH